MSMNSSNKLLKEYVRAVITEDEGYGSMMDAGFGGSPYGVHFASSDALYKTFIKPFVDVVDVTAGKTKEMSARAQNLARVTFEAIATSIMPFFSSDYDEIFQREKEKIDKIRSDYAEVYGATWDALKRNDVTMTAFLCYPAAVLTSFVARKSPKASMNILSILSGGTMDSFFAKVKASLGGFGKAGKGERYSSGGGDSMPITWESLVREDDSSKKKKPSLADIVTNKKVIKKALSSPEAQRMQREARAAVHDTLQTVYERAAAVSTVKSLGDLQKKIGKPIKGADKLNAVPAQEREPLERQLLMNLKKSLKEFYVKSLEAQAKEAIDGGIPKDSGFIVDYAATIKKIKAL